MNWFERAVVAIQREYERRILRASQISAYGQHAPPPDDDDGAAEIVNLPRGSAVAARGDQAHSQ